MTLDLYSMHDFDLRSLIRKLREDVRQRELTRVASSVKLNETLRDLRLSQACADRLRMRRDEIVEEYNDTHRDLLRVESQVTAYRTRVDEGVAKDRAAKLRLENMRASRDIWHRKGLELKAEIQCLIEERDKAEAKVGDLAAIKADQAMRIVRDERDDLRSQMNAAVAQVGRLNRMRGLDEVSLNAARKSVQDRYAEIRKLEDALTCKERRIVELQEGYEQACQSRDYAKSRWEMFSKTNLELDAQLANTHRDLLTVESHVASLIERFETLQAEQNDQGKVSLLEQQLEPLRAERNSLLNEKERLEQQLQQADRQDDRRCITIVNLHEAGEQLASDLASEKARVRVLQRRNSRLLAGEAGVQRQMLSDTVSLNVSLSRRLESTKEQLDIVASAYNALHLETQAIIHYVPAVVIGYHGSQMFDRVPLHCIYCNKAFATFQDARDKEQHEPDCHWVKLEEVAVMTEQDVLRVVQGETG